MNSEYVIFNIVVITGPLIFGFFKKFYFWDQWKRIFLSVMTIAVPYLLWDALVTDKHWMFNPKYTMNFRLAHLPIGEWLFFFTVPIACLFTWEMIIRRTTNSKVMKGKILQLAAFIMPVIGIWLFAVGKQYTGLVFISLSIAIFLDHYSKTDLVLQKRFYLYLIFIILFTLIFNGYLTWRPVVLYGETYQVGFRIFTIPIEDFGYGISMLYMCTVLYERLKVNRLLGLKRVQGYKD